jgi:hypothetical protein
VITVDPDDGSLGFSFTAGYARGDVDATLEALFELPGALSSEREKRVAVVFDEFQEVLNLDPNLPALMRAVFQSQPDVSHLYVGSNRSMMEKLFNDANEPFWRSARQIELGVIDPAHFTPFIHDRFAATERGIEGDVVAAILETTRGHPYGTQELCYAVWEETPERDVARRPQLEAGLERVLRSENAHFTYVWESSSGVQRRTLQALAAEPASAITSDDYRRRHALPGSSSLQRALDSLLEDELVAKEGRGSYRIAEPFLAEWIRRYGS